MLRAAGNRSRCVRNKKGWLTASSVAGLDVLVAVVYCLPSVKVRGIISCVEMLCFASLRKVALRCLVNLEMALRQACDCD